MKNVSEMKYFEPSEKITKILSYKTQNNSPLFFRVLVSYYFCNIASMMRAKIKTHDRGEIPINLYAINLANSGFGKGHATTIIEEQLTKKFLSNFLEYTFINIASNNINKIANERASRNGTDPDEEKDKLDKEFNQAGALSFSFDSATTPAIKQMRHKLLLANCGSLNLHIDEIGSNLLSNMDVLNTFLELYDIGKVKNKLIKNTNDSSRYEDIAGRTPTNMMLFGTPSKLLNGGKVEEEFYSILEAGYARRCLFGFTQTDRNLIEFTPEEIYEMSTNTDHEDFLVDFSEYLGTLAQLKNYNKVLKVSKDVSLLVIKYRQLCEKKAKDLFELDEIRKAEMNHRYFKAIKLAGAYAFIDGKNEVTEDHVYNAIKLIEESGEAFNKLLTREKNYVKLANYIAKIGKEVTHVDLVEDLPFYKGSESQKQQLMNLAIAYGIKNNISIKKYYNNNIEFFKGESLKETDPNKLIISYSKEYTENYINTEVPFTKLHKLTQKDGYHWINHAVSNGYRDDKHCISGFNLLVIDVDDNISIKAAQNMFAEYEYLMYTTKRHTDNHNRFRIIFPTNFVLKLDSIDYKEFMKNVFEWLPFQADDQTGQRSRKWLSFGGQYWYNTGDYFDVTPFIPKTHKAEERKKIVLSNSSLNNLERWFITNTGEGNRSNQLIKYAYMLVDSGYDLETIKAKVLALNSKLNDPLEETEILSTILISASKAMTI